MAAVNTDRAWFIVRGITNYVSRTYLKEKYGETCDISEEDLYLPRRLKTILSQFLSHFKNEKFVTAHNHCVDMVDREAHVKKSFRSGLLEVAKGRAHVEFLRECTLYIMSATEMLRLGFPEAKNIVRDAIYQTCMNTDQLEHLMLWETQPVHKESNGVKDFNNHSHQEKDNGDDDQSRSDVEVSVEVEIID